MRAGSTWDYYSAADGSLTIGDDTHENARADVYLVRMHNGQYRIELDVILDADNVLYLPRGNNRARNGMTHLDTGFRVGAGDGGDTFGSTGIFTDAIGVSLNVRGTIELGENGTAT